MKGRKRTVHITFKCTKHCAYCPIPYEKFNNDVIEFERVVYHPSALSEVIDSIVSQKNRLNGIAISGGEPLLVLERVEALIQSLKRRCGPEFHIHMYTNGELLSPTIIECLEKLGLDELRVDSLSPQIFRLLKNVTFDVACEVPCIPLDEYYSQVINLLEYSQDLNLKYLNLNEFEVTKENVAFVKRHHLDVFADRVIRSSEYAKMIEQYINEHHLPISLFFCSFEIADKIRTTRNRL